jgi:hypothetical protein
MTVTAPPFGPVPAPVRSLPCCRLVSRPCACGQSVTASPHDPAPGVAAHNRTYGHREWWARVEREEAS